MEHLEQCLAQGELSGSLSPQLLQAAPADQIRILEFLCPGELALPVGGWLGSLRALRGGSCRDLWNRTAQGFGCQMAL